MSENRPDPGFAVGEVMLLIDQRDRSFLVTVPPPGDLAVRIHGEPLKSEDLTVLKDGGLLVTATRRRYLVLKPTLQEIIMNMPRQAQIIYPKDLALMLMWGDLTPGQRVLEVGCGHGAMTMTLLRALGPAGELVTYDLRRDHINRTRKNVAMFLGEEHLSRWKPTVGDPSAEEGFAERDMDRLFTDVPEPWTMVEAAAQALRPGAVWVAYIPSVTQMAEQVKSLNAHPYWSLAQGFEALQRFWHVRHPAVRPNHRMSGHTGFMVVGRRRYKEE
jgi:tRNA (adenine57-N1/adenine58-N1)-methyltransferase